MTDRNGNDIRVGDYINIKCVITKLLPDEQDENVEVRMSHPHANVKRQDLKVSHMQIAKDK